jgi:hypothetical protein
MGSCSRVSFARHRCIKEKSRKCRKEFGKKLFSGKKSLRTGKEAGSPHNDGKEGTLVFLNLAQMGRI